MTNGLKLAVVIATLSWGCYFLYHNFIKDETEEIIETSEEDYLADDESVESIDLESVDLESFYDDSVVTVDSDNVDSVDSDSDSAEREKVNVKVESEFHEIQTLIKDLIERAINKAQAKRTRREFLINKKRELNELLEKVNLVQTDLLQLKTAF